MSLEHFRPFLRALLEDYLRHAEAEAEQERLVVTRPMDFTGTGYPSTAEKTLRTEKVPEILKEVLEDKQEPSASPTSAVMPETPTAAAVDPIPAQELPEPPLAPKPSVEPCPIPPRRRSSPAPAKSEPKALPKDSPAPKPKRSMSAKGTASSSSVPRKASASPARTTSTKPTKPTPPLKDSLQEVYANLPDLMDLLPQEDPFESTVNIFGSARDALKRLRGLCDELGDTCFVDPDFGPSTKDPTGKKALIPNGALPAEAFENFPGHDQVLWQRPQEAWPKHHFCGELAEVKPGVFGDAWFLGALCSLSLSEEELFGNPSGYEEPLGIYPRAFWDSEFRRRGLYCFRFSTQGQWRYVVVDDCLPFNGKNSKALFSHSLGLDATPQLWIALMEKAYAKLHGAYFSLWLGFVDDALEDLTSWPSEKLQISKFTKSEGRGKDPAELWSTLLREKDASLICLRADAGQVSEKSELVHVEPQSIHLDARPEAGAFCTGIFRNWAYPILCLREAPSEVPSEGAEVLQFLRLRSFVGSWHGLWGDQDLNWSQASPELVDNLQVKIPASFVHACSRGAQDDGVHHSMLRPFLPLHTLNRAEHDGTFVMRFDDWMTVYSHVLLRHRLPEEAGWNRLQLQSSWSKERCGGTPIPVMQPVLATLKSWARNPQCRLVLEADFDVEVFLTLHQPDARLKGDSSFPFEDQLRQIFVCIMDMDGVEERLEVFDKTRIVRHQGSSAASLLSRRRSVLLRTKLESPGTYAIIPSIWEPELPEGEEVAWRQER